MASLNSARNVALAGLLAGAGLVVGCQTKEPEPAPPDPVAVQQAALSMRQTLMEADPNAKIGMVVTVLPDQPWLSAGNLPVEDFQNGDWVTVFTPEGQVLAVGEVRNIQGQGLHVRYNASQGAPRGPMKGDLVLKGNEAGSRPRLQLPPMTDPGMATDGQGVNVPPEAALEPAGETGGAVTAQPGVTVQEMPTETTPTTEAPATEAPATETPATEAPATETPAAIEAPATETPAPETPAPETPAPETPAPAETPAAETPSAIEAPAAEQPAPEAPIETPAPETPAPETPAPEAPAPEAPAPEAPTPEAGASDAAPAVEGTPAPEAPQPEAGDQNK